MTVMRARAICDTDSSQMKFNKAMSDEYWEE